MTIQQALPTELRTKLRDYPFTKKKPSKQHRPTKVPPDAATRRQIIRSKLRSKMSLSNSDFEFMRENPEEARWLKDHIEPRFWLEFESLTNSQKGQG